MHKTEKKTDSIGISVFGYENKEKHPIYTSKQHCKGKNVDLLLVEEKDKRHYALIKKFNTFMYNHTLHHGKKYFCRYCLQDFSAEEILKLRIKDCFKINKLIAIIMPKKDAYGVKFKN